MLCQAGFHFPPKVRARELDPARHAAVAAEEFASFALSEGTRTTYRKAFSLFRARCAALALSPLPAPRTARWRPTA
ncbi:MAG: hypothetical protein WCF85_20270 [Rhodospirillaceae bacterium]